MIRNRSRRPSVSPARSATPRAARCPHRGHRHAAERPALGVAVVDVHVDLAQIRPLDRRARLGAGCPPLATVVAAGPAPAPPGRRGPAVDRPARLRPAARPAAALRRRRSTSCAIVAGVVVYKAAFIQMLFDRPVLRRLRAARLGLHRQRASLISLFYRPGKPAGLEPHVAIVMPAFNEEDGDRALAALAARARLPGGQARDRRRQRRLDRRHAARDQARSPRSARPRARDRLPREPRQARGDGRRHPRDRRRDRRLRRLRLGRSSRTRCASSCRASPSRRVGRVCGHADVLNVARDLAHADAGGALLRRLQGHKAAESVFSAVTCCSGCFSAYRREAIMPHLDWWENQTFLGVESTFGDDRSLTNCVLRDWKVRYEEKARQPHDRARDLPAVHEAADCAGSAPGRASR